MNIYQHFRPEEHLFIDHVLAWKKEIQQTYQLKVTDFLDPRQQQIIKMLIGTNEDDFAVYLHGGANGAERKRAVIAPYYEEVHFSAYEVVLLEAKFQQKFVTLTHGDIMGAFLSQGIDRRKLGDIYLHDNCLQIIVAAEIATYVQLNLTKIKNASIKLIEQSFSELLPPENNWLEESQTVASLRLDALIKAIYRMSRNEAANLIKRKLVKINFQIVEDPAYSLLEGDLISVRGKGRSKLVEILGHTRKDKIRVTTAKLK